MRRCSVTRKSRWRVWSFRWRRRRRTTRSRRVPRLRTRIQWGRRCPRACRARSRGYCRALDRFTMNDVPEDWRLEGRTCVLTGETAGIGYHAALALAKLGADLVLVGRNKSKLADVAKAAGKISP